MLDKLNESKANSAANMESLITNATTMLVHAQTGGSLRKRYFHQQESKLRQEIDEAHSSLKKPESLGTMQRYEIMNTKHS